MEQVFKRNFGIVPQFILQKSYCPYDAAHLKEVEGHSYLTIPMAMIPIISKPGLSFAGYSVQEQLDLQRLGTLPEGDIRKFKIAFKLLNLHPFDPDEDESVFEEKTPPRRDYAAEFYGEDSSDSGCPPDGHNSGESQEEEFKSSDYKAPRSDIPSSASMESSNKTNLETSWRPKPIVPALMVLGCGRLKAYSNEDESLWD